MIRVRYTQWDGTQSVRLDADKVFEKLGEYLSYTDDVEQAMEWLARQGADFEGTEVVGLDELLGRVRDALREKYEQFNLDHALDEKQRRLDELIDMEKEGLGGPDADARREALDQLPCSISAALQRLRSNDLKDEDARRDLENLLEELDDIRAVEDFQSSSADLFQGKESLGFDEALDLLREIERLKDLEDQILSGKLDAIDAEALGATLGEKTAQDFQMLREMMSRVQQSGLVMQKEGRPALSPQGVRKLGRLALRDIYQGLLRDRSGGHSTDHRGPSEVRPEATRPYAYGDPMNLDLVATLKKALPRRAGVPLDIRPTDFEVYDTELATSTATVLLLDMSWSMSWEGRFAAAKKVALAMETLIRTKYPRDFFAVVGFFTKAVELRARDLPEASWNMGDPFTNLQDGLRMATRLLERQRTRNKHMIVITDGQPTAYFSGGRLYCEWPMSFGGISQRAAQETLKEVQRVTKKGITINTFMLDDSPALHAFVESMTRINKGRALYSRPDHLGEYLLVDYMSKKRKRV